MHQQILQVCAYLVGLPLQLLIIAALLRGESGAIPSFSSMQWPIF